MLNIVSATRMTAFHYNLACPLAEDQSLAIFWPVPAETGFRCFLSRAAIQICLKVPILLGQTGQNFPSRRDQR